MSSGLASVDLVEVLFTLFWVFFIGLVFYLQREMKREGYPLLVGPSRKRFIGAVLDEPRPRARLWGTAAACCRAIASGADIVRVHDVGAIVQTCRMADALWR